LTNGKTSEATDSTRTLRAEPVDHALGDQADAARRAPEAAGVVFRVLADHESRRDPHATVDDDVAHSHVPADLDVRKDHRVLDLAVGIDLDISDRIRGCVNAGIIG
jgi:hypothetical protein